MKFNIITSKIKVRELREAQTSFEASLNLMARFMVDEATGEGVPVGVALEALDELTLDELQEVQTTFMGSFSPNPPSAHRS
jgi:recombinational DNA repair protein RecR